MRPQSLLAFTLAASLSLPASAGDGKLGPSEATFLSIITVAAVPLMLLSGAGQVLSEKVTSEKMEGNRRWEVTNVAPQGERTAVELRSEDGQLKIDMTVATGTARAQGLQVRDRLEIEPIGKAGYAVNKGVATIGVLAQRDSGMVHSKARD